MKFDQDLGGLVWDGQELAKPMPKKIINPASSDTELSYDNWETLWKVQGARLATLPEVYEAIKSGLVADENYAPKMTGTKVMYHENGGMNRLTSNGVSSDICLPLHPTGMNFYQFVEQFPEETQTLFMTMDKPMVIYESLRHYFFTGKREDNHINISFNLNKGGPLERCAVLIPSKDSFPRISLVYVPGRFANSYGVKI